MSRNRRSVQDISIFNVCLDINECADKTSGCNQHCTDFPGSFRCSCTAGYRLNSDGKTCEGRFTKYLLYSKAVDCSRNTIGQTW